MNVRVLLSGLAILMLGLMIVAYDLPQILLLQPAAVDGMRGQHPPQPHLGHAGADPDIVWRIHAEFYAGLGVITAGAALVLFSVAAGPVRGLRRRS